jgi:putative oxidoreductase
MDRYSRYGVVFGRILISAVFIVNGLGIVDQRVAAKELAEAGVSTGVVSILMLAARTLETGAGFALALGIFPKWAALGLLLFLVPATWIGHPFWRLAGTPEFQGQMVNFFKNVAIMGGLLFIMGASPYQRGLKP